MKRSGSNSSSTDSNTISSHASVNTSLSSSTQNQQGQHILRQSHSTPLNSSSNSDYVTLTKFNELSHSQKSGYMSFQKLNTLLPRWKRKFFLLNGNYLRRYRSEDSLQNDYEHESYKEFVLSSQSSIQHTDIKTCFILKGEGSTHGGEGIQWILKTETEEEAKEWIVHISSHIHSLFLQSRPDLQLDLSSSSGAAGARGGAGGHRHQRSFWTLPTSNSAGPVANPVGIRSLPDHSGPRTGEGIYPGEVFEVVQQIQSSSAQGTGITYLALADDRGWVFDKHPTGGYDLIVQLQPQDFRFLEKITTVLVLTSTSNEQVSFHFFPPLFTLLTPLPLSASRSLHRAPLFRSSSTLRLPLPSPPQLLDLARSVWSLDSSPSVQRHTVLTTETALTAFNLWTS
jgi:hypothetical protein